MKKIKHVRFRLAHLPPPTDQFHADSDDALIIGTNTGVTKQPTGKQPTGKRRRKST